MRQLSVTLGSDNFSSIPSCRFHPFLEPANDEVETVPSRIKSERRM